MRPRLIVDLTRVVGVGHRWRACVRWLGRDWLVTEGMFPLASARRARNRRRQFRIIEGGRPE
jgi:hypothetical protein